jgi:hypothetical protein
MRSAFIVLDVNPPLIPQQDKAQQNPTHFPEPTEFNPQRREKDTEDSGEYILYGCKKGAAFTAKHLTIIAITALIKRCAKVKNLRRAQDTEGRLNTARTPDGVQRYLTQEFDQLVPFPTSRFSIRDLCLSSRCMPFFLLDCVNARRYVSY